jgi:hypothetical protein
MTKEDNVISTFLFVLSTSWKRFIHSSGKSISTVFLEQFLHGGLIGSWWLPRYGCSWFGRSRKEEIKGGKAEECFPRNMEILFFLSFLVY